MWRVSAWALAVLMYLLSANKAEAQTDSTRHRLSLHGSLQSDVLTFASEDERIGTGTYDHKFMSHTYAELQMTCRFLQAGARLEYTEHPLPGFEKTSKEAACPFFMPREHGRKPT